MVDPKMHILSLVAFLFPRSPGRTPLAVSKKYEPDLLPFFNAKLSEKFRNTVSDSPEHSPGTLASPGAFGSPM